MLCADCGCDVDHGTVVAECGRPGCCCVELPRRAGGEPARISPEDAYRMLDGHPAWIVERHRIYRDLRFPTFRDAISFVDRVADVAEAAGHHPNILVHEWCFVRLELYSHLADGLTREDVDLAIALDAIVDG